MTSRTLKTTLKSRNQTITCLRSLGDSQAQPTVELRGRLIAKMEKLNGKLEKAGYGR